jgi:hypothetical protein
VRAHHYLAASFEENSNLQLAIAIAIRNLAHPLQHVLLQRFSGLRDNVHGGHICGF